LLSASNLQKSSSVLGFSSHSIDCCSKKFAMFEMISEFGKHVVRLTKFYEISNSFSFYRG
jgi:hypothetical protein